VQILLSQYNTLQQAIVKTCFPINKKNL